MNIEPVAQLIPLTNHEGITAVLGRDLHRFLEVNTEYRHWFPRMVEYGFVAGEDYAVKNDRVQDSLGREREATNHVLTLDMAKQIAMIQRTDKGRQAREYFIECERIAKNSAPAVPQTYAEALRAAADAADKAAALEAKTIADAPKVEYHDTFVADEDLIQFRTLANQVGVTETELRSELERGKWIYNHRTKRWSNRENRMVWESRWRCYAAKRKYFRLVAHHTAPRINGEVRQTLKITPDGAVAIRRALAKWGVIEPQGTLEIV